MVNSPSSLRPGRARTPRPIFRLVNDFDKSRSDGEQNKSARRGIVTLTDCFLKPSAVALPDASHLLQTSSLPA